MLRSTRLLVLPARGCDRRPRDASAGDKPLLQTPRFAGFMHSRLIIALLTAGGIAFACGPRPFESEAASAPAPLTRTANSAALATTLELSVAEGVDLRLHVTNTSGKKLEMTFPTGQTHDFYILDAAGREVWRWSTGRIFTQGVQKKLVDGGSTLSFADRWAGPVAGGTYTAVAVLMSSSHPTEQRVEFSRE
jgi:hypothetical protein